MAIEDVKRHITRALDAIKGGSDTRLHLSADEKAEVADREELIAEYDETDQEAVRRLLAGQEVRGGSLPQTA